MTGKENLEVDLGKEKRDSFKSKSGFIIACVGSAVGMGNIWMFPYRVGQYGGSAFLIPYFICVAIIGFTGVIGEMAFGRAMKTGPIGAFEKATKLRKKSFGKYIGIIPVIGALGIAIGYSVVVGWFIKFLVAAITGDIMSVSNTGEYFGNLATNFGSIGWHILGLIITFMIMILGVSKGIEKLNKILMPAFFILFIILLIKIMTLNGAGEGYKYFIIPKWKLLLNPKTWVYALGQSFFSLSLAGSGTIVYGSYLKKDVDIVDSAKNVAIFDTLAAILAALVVIPAVFAYNMDPTAGPPLMFITLPKVFQEMPMGQLFSIIFFIAVIFAAITSLMNLFEVPIEALQERFKMSRKVAVIIVALISFLIGIFIESGDSVGKWMDIVSIYIIPLGALLAGIMFFWICPDDFVYEEVQAGRSKRIGKWFRPMTKYGFVGLTIIVYILGIFYGGIG